MNNEKDPKSPATTSAAYDSMVEPWRVINTLLGGSLAMRAAGKDYTPQHEAETDKGYKTRLQATVLLNMVEQTRDTLAGKPFAKPVEVSDSLPPAVGDLLDNIDLEGSSLGVFAREWFKEGLTKGFCHVLVDQPRPIIPEDGSPRTLADDRRENIRPYWVLIKPENLFFAQSEMVGGAEILTHVRILETYTTMAGFSEVQQQRIRVLTPGMVTLYEQNPDNEEEWLLSDQWETGMGSIPLVTFYANKSGLMQAKPPLLDLAHLNVTHWQSTSDQRNILRITRFPVLACTGASEEQQVVLGPNKVLYNPDPKGSFYYLEHKGNAVSSGREDLRDLEEKMAGYGAEFLKKRPGVQTATARILDSAEASSDLSAMVVSFEDALSQCLNLTAEWLSLPDIGTGLVELVRSFANDMPTQEAILQTLDNARDRRDLSRLGYLEALGRLGVLQDDFDAEADSALMGEEEGNALDFSGGAANADS